MAYVCYDFNSAPICDELENFNDCYVPCIKDILKHIKFVDMKPYVRYINNDLEFLYHFKIPVHFTNNIEMIFNDMIVRLSKRVNRLDINDFYYYYVIEFINSNTKISYSSQTNDIKNLLLLTSERLRLFETEIQICDM